MARDQYGLSFGWSHALLGGLDTSYSTSNSFDGQQSQYLNGSWGKGFRHFSVDTNVERSRSSAGNRQRDSNTYERTSKAMYVNITIPLGKNHSPRSNPTSMTDAPNSVVLSAAVTTLPAFS
ncbi:hypothetical protein EMIT0P265_180020 [Pseudomonas zeae]